MRRKSRQIKVGDVLVGGDTPISVQTMTNTPTEDVKATVEQVKRCEEAGADIVRISVPNEKSAVALKKIIKQSEVPIVADIHFNYMLAIEAAKAGASALRINPGNIGSDERVREVISAAKDYGCSMRIGVNAGSLEKELLVKYKEPCPEALVESALHHAKILEDKDFLDFKISVKASSVNMCVDAYRLLAENCAYPLHLGITEAGGLISGTVKSSVGLGILLAEGIGDTIRVSLSADPVEEVKIGFEILKALELRTRGVNLISCPSCARQGFPVAKIVAELEEKLQHISEPIEISVLGCIVNGIGEAAHTKIGIVGGNDGHMLYINGKKTRKIQTEKIVDTVLDLVESV